ncbi:MAG: hypothetical protein ACTHLZ_00620 [Tepidisphaeraceae bacterium]
MAKDKIGVTSGQYFVEVGKLESGRQQRFYLGRVSEVTEDEARLRRHRVRQFWQKFTVWNRLNGYPVLGARPLSYWTNRCVEIAKQISKGATRVQFDEPITEQMLLDALAELNAHYEGVVTFIAAPERHGSLNVLASRHRDLAAAGRLAAEADAVSDGEGDLLYDWLERFAIYAKSVLTEATDTGETEATEWSTSFVKHVLGIRRATPDIPLSNLDWTLSEQAGRMFKVEKASAYW